MLPIHLRSDTVTRPTPQMRLAIANSAVGPDVIDIAPTCQRLDRLTAQLLKAVAATGIEAEKWARHFDTVSVCFSKGLGAPVGSALAGTKDAMKEARRHRKLFGGGMRQVGIIAAGALFALENHRARLTE